MGWRRPDIGGVQAGSGWRRPDIGAVESEAAAGGISMPLVMQQMNHFGGGGILVLALFILLIL